MIKKCSKCGEYKLATSEFFNKRKVGKFNQTYKLNSQCKECTREYARKWYKDKFGTNKEIYIEMDESIKKLNPKDKRKIRENRAGKKYSKEQFDICLKFFDYKCAYTGKSLSNQTISKDHIIPISKGGKNSIDNIVPTIPAINSSKCSYDFEKWYIKQNYFDKNRMNKIYEWIEFAKENLVKE